MNNEVYLLLITITSYVSLLASLEFLSACSKIDDFDGGKVIYTSETPAEGTTASFECDQTKFLVGTKRTVCTTEGTWDLTQVPTCTSG